MTISELLEAIRAPYVRLLAESAHRQPAYVEPAYRQASGALAVDGSLELPCRADFILREAGSAEPSTVESTSQLQFETVVFTIGSTSVAVSPFVWDWVPVEVTGLSRESATQVLKDWFLRWFDGDDQNNETEEGLFGVAHFMSEPESTEQGIRVTTDLGSAPAEAVEDLMFHMSDAGAKELRVG